MEQLQSGHAYFLKLATFLRRWYASALPYRMFKSSLAQEIQKICCLLYNIKSVEQLQSGHADFLNLATSYVRARSADARGCDVGMCLPCRIKCSKTALLNKSKMYCLNTIFSVEQFQSGHADVLNLATSYVRARRADATGHFLCASALPYRMFKSSLLNKSTKYVIIKI